MKEQHDSQNTTENNVIQRVFSKLSHPVTLYGAILTIVTIFGIIISSSTIEAAVLSRGVCKRNETCKGILGYSAVYRVFMAHALFHLVLAMLTSDIGAFQKWREKIHSGYWGIKFFALLVLVLLCLMIPREIVFEGVVSILGFLCGLVFLVFQMLVLCGLTEKLVNCVVEDLDSLVKEKWNNPRFLLYILFISILFLFSLLLFIYLFLVFAYGSSCLINVIFLGYLLTHCCVVSSIAFVPQIRKTHSQKGVLTSLCCSFYIIFVAWLAVSLNTKFTSNVKITDGKRHDIELNTIISLVVLFGSLAYIIYDWSTVFSATINTFSSNREKKPPLENDKTQEDAETFGQHTDDNSCPYNYATIHLSMILVSFYAMTSVTKWTQPEVDENHVIFKNSRLAMFVLMVTAFLCAWLFTWILVKPVLLEFVNKLREKNAESFQKESKKEFKPASINVSGYHNKSTHKPATIGASGGQHKNINEPVEINVSGCQLENTQEPAKMIFSGDHGGNINNCEGKENEKKDERRDVLRMDEIFWGEREKEIIRLQEKVLRLQEKIGILQYKVSVLQGVNL